MNPEDVLQANLSLVERVVARVSRRARLERADAQDFASEVMLALIDDDYAVIRKFEGRSSFAGYISVVIEHLLLDRRVAERGRWNASSEARRLGPAAVALEKLVYRDGRPLDAALPFVRALDPSITRQSAEALLARLPLRITRPRPVDLDAVDPDVYVSQERADTRALAADTTRMAEHASDVVRTHLDALPAEDRTLLRLRFGADMSIADISQAMSLPQRPLYRRFEALLVRLRTALRAADIDESAAAVLIDASCDASLDFGLDDRKTANGNPSFNEEPR